MICRVCKIELGNAQECPVCNFIHPSSVGDQSAEVKAQFEKLVVQYREDYIGKVKISIRGYVVQGEDGDLKVVDSQDILLGERLDKCDMDRIYWNKTPFQKMGQMPTDITLVIDNNGESKVETLNITIPYVDSWWNVGIMLKPGYKLVVVAGNEGNYGETGEIAIK